MDKNIEEYIVSLVDNIECGRMYVRGRFRNQHDAFIFMNALFEEQCDDPDIQILITRKFLMPEKDAQ